MEEIHRRKNASKEVFLRSWSSSRHTFLCCFRVKCRQFSLLKIGHWFVGFLPNSYLLDKKQVTKLINVNLFYYHERIFSSLPYVTRKHVNFKAWKRMCVFIKRYSSSLSAYSDRYRKSMGLNVLNLILMCILWFFFTLWIHFYKAL